MDIKELLKPRYRNEIDFPGNPFKVGDILYLFFDNKSPYRSWYLAKEEKSEIYLSEHPENYKELFKPLKWWEQRKASDMPKYIKFYEPLPTEHSIWKVNEWRFGLKRPLVKTDCDVVWRELSIMDLPATHEQYQSYINNQVK